MKLITESAYVPENFTGIAEYKNEYKEWHKNGKLHREDGPAIEYANGDKEWYKNGQLQREDGPAVEDANGDKFWYKNGQLHREDGPAMEYANGTKYWYKNGIEVSPMRFRLENMMKFLRRYNYRAVLMAFIWAALIYVILSLAIFQYLNPKSNDMSLFREFMSVVKMEKLETYQ